MDVECHFLQAHPLLEEIGLYKVYLTPADQARVLNEVIEEIGKEIREKQEEESRGRRAHPGG